MYLSNSCMMTKISAQLLWWKKICLPNLYLMKTISAQHISNENISAQFLYHDKNSCPNYISWNKYFPNSYMREKNIFPIYIWWKNSEASPAVLSLHSQNSWNVFRSFSYLVFYLLGETTQSICRLIFQSSLASLINIPGWNCTFEVKVDLVDIWGVVFGLCSVGIQDIWIFEGLLRAVLGLRIFEYFRVCCVQCWDSRYLNI